MTRVRRIKCDECRPSCYRCTSTGRVCDGYEQESQAVRDAAMRRKGKRPLLPQQPATESPALRLPSKQLTFLSNMPAVEGQAFAFFREHTLHEIPGGFESSYWESLVLQLSLHESSVRHAAVAVGAIHRSMRGQCPSLGTEGYLERANPLAMKQYIKSLNHLRKRLSGPNNCECGHVALVTCLLFVCFEMLRGNRPGAVAHLRMGLRILLTLGPSPVCVEPDKEKLPIFDVTQSHISSLDYLAGIYARLDYESTMFGEQSPKLTLGSSRDKIGPSLQVPSFFMDLANARKSLDILSNAFYRLRGELLHLAASEMANDIHEDWAVRYCVSYSRIRTVDLSKRAILLQQQSCLKFSLEHRASAFNVLSSTLGETRLMILLEVQHIYIYFLTCTLREAHEEACDHFQPNFQRVVDLGKKFVDVNSSKHVPSRPNPTFTLESGIIPSLYLVAMKCRNTKIRHDAIALLDRTRCQEGMWEGSLIARFFAEVAKIEEEAAGAQDGRDNDCTLYIPERARFSDVVVAMSETPGYGRLICARFVHESTGRLEISERTFQFGVMEMLSKKVYSGSSKLRN